jgi:hypothetical protein
MDIERKLLELETKWRGEALSYGSFRRDIYEKCADELKAVREALREPGAPNAEREIPLCANHAETWFCERNHLPNPTANCVLCAFAPTGTQPGAGAAPPVSQERSAMEREAGTR